MYLQRSVGIWRCCYCCCFSCVSSPFLRSVSHEYGILLIWSWHALTSVLCSLIILHCFGGLVYKQICRQRTPFTWGLVIPGLGTIAEHFCWDIFASRLVNKQLEPSWLVVAVFESALYESFALKCYIYHVCWALSLLSRPASPAVNAVNLQESSLCFTLSTLVRQNPLLHAQFTYFQVVPFLSQ